jgi:hypothetical protein
MLYPITVGYLYLQTDNILYMTADGRGGFIVTMNDAAVSTFNPTAAQFADIINIVNGEANH